MTFTPGEPYEIPPFKEWLKTRDKYRTGYCNPYGNKQTCEGTKPVTWQGEPMKTCPFFLSCPCECHYRVDQMFAMVGRERIEVPNPDYVPYVRTFLMPLPREESPVADASTDDGVIPSPDTQRPSVTPPRAVTAPLAERRTETGRSARGGLEAQVWEACSQPEVMANEKVTPIVISDWIVGKYKIPTPSSGAINAVWDRWEKLGFAEQAKKPNRFVRFTGTGTWNELQEMKASAKRKKKLDAAAAARTLRPRR